jgi:hypothetical protein
MTKQDLIVLFSGGKDIKEQDDLLFYVLEYIKD